MHARSVRLRCGLLLALAALLTLSVAAVPAQADPVLAAAGDIACAPPATPTSTTCQGSSTAAEITAANPDAVAALGDNQYVNGTYPEFMGPGAYDQTWGAFKSKTYPAPGNHEYGTSGAAGYFQYFSTGGPANANIAQGYYSFDLGAWHVVSLNSNCSAAGVCDASAQNGGSVDHAQVAWLNGDLAAHPNQCTLAFWHHPYASSGRFTDGGAAGVKPLWDALYAAHADVVLNGHAHQYERFAPMNPDKVAVNDGITEIISGSGGDDHHAVFGVQANSQFRDATDFGVVFLTLHGNSFDYSFRTIDGTMADSGSRACNDKAPTRTVTPQDPPPAPTSDAPATSAPPASTSPPATTPVPCAQYSGTTKARCKARLARTTGLAACRKRSTAATRAACTRTVAVRYAKAILAIDLGTCAKKSTRSARATCSRAAQVRYRKAVRAADLTACRAQSTSTRRKACTIRAQATYRRALARL